MKPRPLTPEAKQTIQDKARELLDFAQLYAVKVEVHITYPKGGAR